MKKVCLFILVLIAMNLSAQENFKGNNWSARKVNNTYIVSIKDKSSLMESLTDFVISQKIRAGQITGIGAVNEAILRFYNPGTKEYVDKTFSEQMEIPNLSGNIAEIKGKITIHAHVTLGRSNYTALAGHLLEAKIRGAGEFFVYPINSEVIKVKNDDVGLNLYDFEN